MPTDHSTFETVTRQQQEQMLKLVTNGFCKELLNYGVQKPDILTVASHLLDHVLEQNGHTARAANGYNRSLQAASVRNEWKARKRLSVDAVTILPFSISLVDQVAAWLDEPGVRSNFISPYPEKPQDLHEYFRDPSRFYFSITFQGEPVGIIGAENIDLTSSRLEMRKLVGSGENRGKGIGKRATFAFLFYIFQIADFQKVYIHSTDVNIHNINLNSQFGFHLEGVFMQEIQRNGSRQDVVRMGLMREDWEKAFGEG